MWKKFLTLMACVVVLACGSVNSAMAADAYKEGTHYQVRSEKVTKTKEIREFFSFWCGHCFAMQGDFDTIAKAFPKARFERNLVAALGGMMGPESQRAFVISQNLGIEDLFVKKLFERIHVDHEMTMEHRELVSFMASIGVPQDKFEREFNAFPVIGKVALLDKWAKDAGIEAVPELLVNGKYLVTMESVDTVDELIALIDYLLNKDNVPDAK